MQTVDFLQQVQAVGVAEPMATTMSLDLALCWKDDADLTCARDRFRFLVREMKADMIRQYSPLIFRGAAFSPLMVKVAEGVLAVYDEADTLTRFVIQPPAPVAQVHPEGDPSA